ncbi:MAG TPA: hypothetical protein VGM67_01820 [Gemmatimonadaceae bacterium]|jgi:hypothetical protein
MFALARGLFLGGLALVALIPLGILLAVIGLPIVAVLCLLALPLLLVLFLVGLPLLIVGSVVLGLMGAVFGVLMAFLSVGVVAIKVAFIVLVPLLILAWIARRIFGPTSARV